MPPITTDYVPINFMIDTGMTYSCLHPQDTIGKIAIDPTMLADPTRWSRRRTTHGIGGWATNYVHVAHYMFHHDDGSKALSVTTETIDIVQPTATNTAYPSLLGMDMLRYFKMRMDYASGIIVLEL